MAVPSPCIHVCVIDERSGFCRGCRRTLPEIVGWASSTDESRLAVLERLKDRAVRRD
jgi:uncharacterized protein